MHCKAKWTEQRCNHTGTGPCNMLCNINLHEVNHIIDCEITEYEGELIGNGTIYKHVIRRKGKRSIELTEDYYGRPDGDEYCLDGFALIEYLVIDGKTITGEYTEENYDGNNDKN